MMNPYDEREAISEEREITIAIVAPEDGGLTIYEAVNGGESKPRFSGNLSEVVKYLEMRMARIVRPQPQLVSPDITPRSMSEIKQSLRTGFPKRDPRSDDEIALAKSFGGE